MTLDCTSFRLQQPRVISVHSYYLTSLVNLSFCRLDVTFIFSKYLPITTTTSFPKRESLVCWNISLVWEGASLRRIFGFVFSFLAFEAVLRIFKSCYFYMSLFSYVDYLPYDLLLESTALFYLWGIPLPIGLNLPVHWYHPFCL